MCVGSLFFPSLFKFNLILLFIYFFPLYGMGTKLHIHVYLIFPPIVVLRCKYLDTVLKAAQRDLIANPFQEQ